MLKKAGSEEIELTNMANENHIQVSFCFIYIVFNHMSIFLSSKCTDRKVGLYKSMYNNKKKLQAQAVSTILDL
jgi:hypothetical protein